LATLLLFLAGCAAVAAAWWWLARANGRDRDVLASALGLEPVDGGSPRHRSDRGQEREVPVARGRREGRGVELLLRTLRARRSGRRAGSAWTVLALVLQHPVPVRLLVEPSIRAAILDAESGPLPEVGTGDPAFDAVFRVAATDPAAVPVLLDAELRAALLDLRTRVSGTRDAGTAAQLADTAVLGALELETERVTIALRGTPMPHLAGPLAAALPILERLAARAESSTRKG
jgi:hypothetical protein